MTLEQNVEQVITDSINNIAKTMPNVAKKVINDGTFITSMYLTDDYVVPVTDIHKKAGAYLIIDFTLKAKNIPYKDYQK